MERTQQAAEVIQAVPDAARAARALQGRRLVVLTGAGISTDSGIPDYRGPGSPPRRPMTYQEFVSGPEAQRRYWARAHVGWTRMSAAEPNPAHHSLVSMEAESWLTGLVTQNVDGLHERAGHRRLVALHGRIADVMCMRCGRRSPRTRLHDRLERLNPGFRDRSAESAPDGDAVVEDTDDFVIAGCEMCGGALKPDVIFFGENVPKPRVAEARSMVSAAEALLVVGSSLQVMSGLRFVRQAAMSGTPVVIVNRGATRGDGLATVKVDGGCAETLAALTTRS